MILSNVASNSFYTSQAFHTFFSNFLSNIKIPIYTTYGSSSEIFTKSIIKPTRRYNNHPVTLPIWQIDSDKHTFPFPVSQVSKEEILK